MTPDERSFIAGQLAEFKASMDRVHQRIDRHAERNDRNFAEVKAKLDMTNGRLGALERWRAELKGALRAVDLVRPVLTGVVVGVVVAALSQLL